MTRLTFQLSNWLSASVSGQYLSGPDMPWKWCQCQVPQLRGPLYALRTLALRRAAWNRTPESRLTGVFLCSVFAIRIPRDTSRFSVLTGLWHTSKKKKRICSRARFMEDYCAIQRSLMAVVLVELSTFAANHFPDYFHISCSLDNDDIVSSDLNDYLLSEDWVECVEQERRNEHSRGFLWHFPKAEMGRQSSTRWDSSSYSLQYSLLDQLSTQGDRLVLRCGPYVYLWKKQVRAQNTSTDYDNVLMFFVQVYGLSWVCMESFNE